MELKLSSGPRLPKHLSLDKDGLLFLYMKAARAPLPECFARPSLARSGWETMIFGLESDRFQMRQRFTQWLTEANDKRDEEALQRLGNLLGGCYHYLFGGRSQDKDADHFYDWIFTNLQGENSPKIIWARGLSCCPRPEAKQLAASLGLNEPLHTQEEDAEAQPDWSALETGDVSDWLLRTWRSSSLEAASEQPPFIEKLLSLLEELLPRMDYEAESDEHLLAYRGLQILLVRDRAKAKRLISALNERFDADELARTGRLFCLCNTVTHYVGEAHLFSFDGPFLFTDFAREQGKLAMVAGETGHVPADHVSVLYLLSSMVACLGDIYFEQASLCERAVYEALHEDEEAPRKAKDPEVFRERDFIEVTDTKDYFDDHDPAWIRLRAYRAGEVLTGTVKGNGDYRDIEGVVGFMNNILQYYGKDQRLAALFADDESLSIIAGSKEELHAWREQGLLSFGEE